MGSQAAAPIELATGGLAVVAIGGFGGSPGASSIMSWVAAHYTAQTVGGTAVYDLTKPAS